MIGSRRMGSTFAPGLGRDTWDVAGMDADQVLAILQPGKEDELRKVLRS